MEKDTYKTISSPSTGVYKEKGSRFIALAYPVSDQRDIKPIIDELRKEHHEARHHCYAWMIGTDHSAWRINDDGEPSGTAGRPILGQINSVGLTNILIVVIRYFGGTLLGVSGLRNAYKTAAMMALQNAEIIKCTINVYYKITFPYISMNDVMKVLKDENINHSEQKYDLDCSLTIRFRESAAERITARLSRIDGIKLKYLETR